MQGIAREVAHRRNISIDGLAIGTWRKNFLGNASAPKSVPKNKRTDWLKEECIKECARRGWVVKYHDEADALGILVYERARLVPEWQGEGGLFGFGAPPKVHPDSVRA